MDGKYTQDKYRDVPWSKHLSSVFVSLKYVPSLANDLSK